MSPGDGSRSRRRLELLGTAVDFLGRVDYRNLRMLPNALSILARPSATDWYDNRALVAAELPRAVRNLLVAPDDMNDFQRHGPVAGYVSSPGDGVLAGFTDRGRLSTLCYPHTGFTQQIPYFETGEGPLNGARPREGGFFGVETADGVTWLWESAFDHEMAPGSDPGDLRLTYDPRGDAPVSAAERVAVPPGSGTVVRELTVRNESDRSVDRVVYHVRANANDRQQYPPGVTSPNRVTAGDGAVTWRDLDSETRLRLSADRDAVETGAAEGPLADLFETARGTVEGRRVSGYLAVPVDLAPGESTTVRVSTTGSGADVDGGAAAADSTGAGATVVSDGAGDVAALDARGDGAVDPAAPGGELAGAPSWRDVLADAPTDAVPDEFAAQYERSLVAIAKLFDPASGSISAAPNAQPLYYPSWPRDGAFIAVALAEAGIAGPARAYLAQFLPGVQEADGGFEQCYASDGTSAGVVHRENDQQGIYAHAVRRVYEVTGDDAFLRAAWPAVEGALEYTVEAISDNGLLRATPDFAEMPSHARQSLWTNAFAYRGLRDGARLATVVDADGDADRYRRAAKHVGDAMDRQFFRGRDRFATKLTIRGAERDDNVAFAAAVHPTGWADEYGHAATILDGLAPSHHESDRYWLPREFTYAAACYAAGRTDEADGILADLQTETLPGGTLAEEVDDGDHAFAALGWANAAFVHALHVREGIAADFA